jgi:formylglycine-generating enzyme required for sulfatase activity
VLNACSTAVTAEAKPFSGVATALVQAGIPAVVAMQTSVTDQAALQFSQVFYESIADGCPIDTSVAEGRKAIEFSASHTVEWAIPELFMRVGDGLLFNFDLSASHTAAPAYKPVPPPPAPSAGASRNSEMVIEPPPLNRSPNSFDSRLTSTPKPAPPVVRGVQPGAAHIDARPVTNEEFQRFVEAGGGKPPSTWQRGRCPREKAALPVTGITWYQAVAYAQWKGKRLPTAAEWDNAISGLERSGALWEWTADEVKPRGLGRKETKRALRGGPSIQSTDRPQTSAWPDEQLDYIGFRCAQ